MGEDFIPEHLKWLKSFVQEKYKNAKLQALVKSTMVKYVNSMTNDEG
jgi:hypothetical protein